MKKKKKWSILLIIILLIGIAGGAFVYMQMNNKDRLARDESALGGILPGKSPNEIEELLNEKVAEGMVNIGIQAEPVFEKGGKKGKIGIENTPGNKYSFQVDIIMDKTGKTLYSSGLIEPEHYVEYISLNQTLKEGEHPATAVFTTYSFDETEDEIAKTEVKLTLVVRDRKIY